jgi:hypothetical protein
MCSIASITVSDSNVKFQDISELEEKLKIRPSNACGLKKTTITSYVNIFGVRPFEAAALLSLTVFLSIKICLVWFFRNSIVEVSGMISERFNKKFGLTRETQVLMRAVLKIVFINVILVVLFTEILSPGIW